MTLPKVLGTRSIIGGNQLVYEIEISDPAADTWSYAFAAFTNPASPVAVVGPDDILVTAGEEDAADSIVIVIPGTATRTIPPGSYTVHLIAQQPDAPGHDWLAKGQLTVEASPLVDDIDDIETIPAP